MADRMRIGYGVRPDWDKTLTACAFAAGFAVFLVIALVAEMMSLQWRSWLPGAEAQKSTIGGVRAAVYTLLSHIP